MKQLIFFLLMGIYANIVFAQDVIFMKNGDKIKSKILEITKETIKYKDFDFQDGPVRNIDKSDVSKVIYENGKEESIISSEGSYNGKYTMLGSGLGMSYGIIGVRFQQRFGKNVGFGYHAGLGYLPGGPTANLSFSIGAKFFPWRSLYVDLQFGIIGWEYQNDTKEDVNQLGISMLTGGDWLFGNSSRFGINFGIGFSYHFTSKDYTVTPAGDLGFIIRF
ncbi:MAG: hypothetical protein KKA81_14260 [Bacteroidetes bacterium]|nr:hypothetical protein [Bacteroidota bacterium]